MGPASDDWGWFLGLRVYGWTGTFGLRDYDLSLEDLSASRRRSTCDLGAWILLDDRCGIEYDSDHGIEILLIGIMSLCLSVRLLFTIRRSSIPSPPPNKCIARRYALFMDMKLLVDDQLPTASSPRKYSATNSAQTDSMATIIFSTLPFFHFIGTPLSM
ncbi:hypothetical protein SISNIDRAFT_313835 [Sistotremastrum niveocremeum HHB9708]|uniref:Uncharacterized protein n=1 Tax=Sistotremastrum niveocremeum HHB9708 TaxID=1314777 RepID=A0A164XY74_9AGAM|nr:hypothetical protein SISNIDRAFT_313835 [Sistotremastrum niveocremeum HHB9708]